MEMERKASFSLTSLPKGVKATIVRIAAPKTPPLEEGQAEEILKKFLQMGFLEGIEIEILQEAPWTQDPILVCIRQSFIALRRREMEWIEVLPCSSDFL